MITPLLIIGAIFFLAGLACGLTSVYWGSRLQAFLYNDHNEVYCRLAGSDARAGGPEGGSVNSGNLWKYIKSNEDNGNAEILKYKKNVIMAFKLFCFLCLAGISSFVAGAVGFLWEMV